MIAYVLVKHGEWFVISHVVPIIYYPYLKLMHQGVLDVTKSYICFNKVGYIGGPIKSKIGKKLFRKKNLSLFVSIFCIIGILSIFFFDAYLGIYDSLSYTDGEHTRELIGERYVRNIYTNHGNKLHFEYEITNNNFKDHETHVVVTVFISGDEILILHSSVITVESFDSVTVGWILDSSQLNSDVNYYLEIDTVEHQRSVRMKFYAPRTRSAELITEYMENKE